MEAQGETKVMNFDIDEDFQFIDDVFSIEKDEEILLVIKKETLCCFESKLVREESVSMPKLVIVKEEDVHFDVTVESKEAKVTGRSKKKYSDDRKKYESNALFKKHLIKCGRQDN